MPNKKNNPFSLSSTTGVSNSTYNPYKKNDELEERISFLRQWLNEDRITDPKKMVTNDDIKHWLKSENYRSVDSIKEALPERKHFNFGGKTSIGMMAEEAFVNGYNQAIEDMKKELGIKWS